MAKAEAVSAMRGTRERHAKQLFQTHVPAAAWDCAIPTIHVNAYQAFQGVIAPSFTNNALGVDAAIAAVKLASAFLLSLGLSAISTMPLQTRNAWRSPCAAGSDCVTLVC